METTEEIRLNQENKFIQFWSKKTIKQIEKEIKSLSAYMERNSEAYHWHGRDITPPGCLADGDKMMFLREILSNR